MRVSERWCMPESKALNGTGEISRNISIAISTSSYVLNLDEARALRNELTRMIANIERTHSKSRAIVPVRNAPAA